MDLLDEVEQIRADWRMYVEPTGLPLEVFEDVGVSGISELNGGAVALEDSKFANALYEEIGFMPLEVVRAICLGSAMLLVGIAAHKKGEEYAVPLLLDSMNHLGFVRGVAVGMLYDDASKKDLLSKSGRQGGLARHQHSRELKEWALERAKAMRGADIEIARNLAKMVPDHLKDSSKDHSRLIYEALRANRKNK